MHTYQEINIESTNNGSNWATLEQQQRLLALVYDGLDRNLYNNVNNFEKGKATDITFSWHIESDDDVLTLVQFDGIDKLSQLISSQVFIGIENTITKILQIAIQSGNNPANLSSTAYARVPQFSGKLSSGTTEPTYTQIGLANYQKVISASTINSKSFTLVDEYPFFITNNSNPKLTDIDTQFEIPIGDWGSVDKSFIKKEVVIILANGDNENVTLVRSTEPLTQILNVKIQ